MNAAHSGCAAAQRERPGRAPEELAEADPTLSNCLRRQGVGKSAARPADVNRRIPDLVHRRVFDCGLEHGRLDAAKAGGLKELPQRLLRPIVRVGGRRIRIHAPPELVQDFDHFEPVELPHAGGSEAAVTQHTQLLARRRRCVFQEEHHELRQHAVEGRVFPRQLLGSSLPHIELG